jgi:hypothetical protein
VKFGQKVLTSNMKENIKIKINIFLIVTAFFIALPVLASEFSFDIQNKEVFVGQQFQIDLNINTEKENINAVEGKIVFPINLLELSEIREGNSIVNLWIEKPTYKEDGIVFSGITPGGYVLNKGLIFSLIFKAKKEGNALISIENSSALKNDGNGTKSKLKISNLEINISDINQTNEDETFEIIDKESPDTFKPEVSRDPNLFDNKWFVVFAAQDKGSGIDRYEIKESRYNIFDFSKWVSALSPYVLTDQELKSNIFVRAIDKAGNERIVKLTPENPIPWYENFEEWFIIISVLIAALIYFFLTKKIKK